jgi:hypothetical protein
MTNKSIQAGIEKELDGLKVYTMSSVKLIEDRLTRLERKLDLCKLEPERPAVEKKEKDMEFKIGSRVIVYDRYLFAVPVRGWVTEISDKDGALRVSFDDDNPGGHNVNKHDGKFFHHQQCRFYEPKPLPSSELGHPKTFAAIECSICHEAYPSGMPHVCSDKISIDREVAIEWVRKMMCQEKIETYHLNLMNEIRALSL